MWNIGDKDDVLELLDCNYLDRPSLNNLPSRPLDSQPLDCSMTGATIESLLVVSWPWIGMSDPPAALGLGFKLHGLFNHGIGTVSASVATHSRMILRVWAICLFGKPACGNCLR